MTGFDGLLPPSWTPSSPPLVGEENVRVEPRATGDADFAATLQTAMRGLSDLGNSSHEQAMALVRGEPVHVHEVLVSMGKSEVAFNLALEVRNRLLQAWETLQRSVL